MPDRLRKSKKGNDQKHQFCTFHISNYFFGIDILDVKEIIDEFHVTKIHHAPEDMFGFINLRGHVHLVLNLRVILNIKTKAIDEANRIILFTPSVGESFGVLVDRIEHMEEVTENQIEYRIYDKNIKHFEMDQRLSQLAIGTCKLNKLLIILDARKLLSTLKNKDSI